MREIGAGIATAIDRLGGLIDNARRAVVFTGAGISTESGIPDFRSPGGIWSKVQPIDYRDFIASEDHRREYWRQKFAAHDAIARARPNRGQDRNSGGRSSCFGRPGPFP